MLIEKGLKRSKIHEVGGMRLFEAGALNLHHVKSASRDYQNTKRSLSLELLSNRLSGSWVNAHLCALVLF